MCENGQNEDVGHSPSGYAGSRPPARAGVDSDDSVELHWQVLQQEWQAAKTAYESALREIDAVAERHLEGDGPAPTKRMAEIRDDLLFRMCEARGALDQFIDEGLAG